MNIDAEKINKLEQGLFVLLLIIHLVVIWTLDLFLTQDGPSHLYNSKLLIDLVLNHNPELYGQFFVINTNLFPNWFSSVLLSVLLLLFEPIIAEKVLISILSVCLPLVFRYTILKINENNSFLSLIAFFFAINYFLIYGFYNFCFSLIFLLLFIGLFHQYRQRVSIYSTIGMAVFLLLIYFSHPVALILSFLLIGFDSLFEGIQTGINRKFLVLLAHKCLMVSPSLILFLIFFFNSQGSDGQLFVNNFNLSAIAKLFTLRYFTVFNEYEFIVHLLLCLFILLLFWRIPTKLVTKKTGIKSPYLLATIAVCLFMYFFVNDSLAGGGFLTRRLAFMVFFLTVIWLCQYEINNKLRRTSLIFISLLSIILVAVRYPSQSKASTMASEIDLIDQHIVDHSVILFVNLAQKGGAGDKQIARVRMFKHLIGYLASKKEVISIDNYEANTQYFPINWQGKTNPYPVVLDKNDSSNDPDWTQFDILKYRQVSNVVVNYVLIWGNESVVDSKFDRSKLQPILDSGYKLTYSTPSGMLKLYQLL